MSFKTNCLPYIQILIFPVLLFSQNNSKAPNFKKVISEHILQLENPKYVSKISAFFINEQPDSILVYTTKAFNNSTLDAQTSDFYNFLRGFSFYKKRILHKAEEELLKVSKDFTYYHTAIAFLGTVTLESSQFKKALNYFKQIENFSKSELLTIEPAKVKDNIGVCHLHLENYEEAERYLTESLKYIRKLNDIVRLVTAYGNLANLNYVQYKDDKAIPLFQKAYKLAITTDDFISKQNTALNMAIVEENRKDLAKALVYRKEYEKWRDSINNQNKIYATVEAEKKIAVEKEQKQVAIFKADNKVKTAQRNTYLYSAIILLLMLGVSAYLYREKVKRNKIINAQKEDLDELNATKDKLFSIVSHDLRSSVNAIKTSNKKLLNKLETKKLDEVDGLLQNNSAIVNGAYNLLDNLLNWALLQTKQTHFEITKLRLASIVDHVTYNYKAMLADKELSLENTISKKELVYADQESLKIILRNLIDNAIKFTNSGGKITIYTESDDAEFCHLIVEDTGIGMNEATRVEVLKDTTLLAKKQHENIIGTGLGMQLCKSMIKKNNGSLSIESELGKGTKMIISLPKNLPNEPNKHPHS
ncbi:sensor histidine kinase RcsC [Kordia sp. SMS9]|uniref:ATP-binding protein n=1 Tax=Kordia sp. SMS9 TaxID=2282170 RepID=UPI000E0DFC52|nr:tetratricopeptide repeat-containing sensor histidine kinase [Kordia sp. SMS9]AXG71958.1 sensor histidine kinase RcsC [Kordia sp. SMS9]